MPGIILVLLAIVLAICFAVHSSGHPADSCIHSILAKPKKVSKKG
jgi:hypothetical protein